MNKNTLKVMDKDVFHAMDLGVQAAGGLRRGAGHPWRGACGCLLSVASMVDGRIPIYTSIYETPKESEPVLTELYRVFGMPPKKKRDPQVVYDANDSTCGYGADSRVMSWTEFAAEWNIVPSVR